MSTDDDFTPPSAHMIDFKPIWEANQNAKVISNIAFGSVVGFLTTSVGASVMDNAAAVSALSMAANVAVAGFVATIPIHLSLIGKKSKLEEQYVNTYGNDDQKAAYTKLLADQKPNLNKSILTYMANVAGIFAAVKLAPVIGINPSISAIGVALTAMVLSAKVHDRVTANRNLRNAIAYEVVDDQEKKHAAPKV